MTSDDRLPVRDDDVSRSVEAFLDEPGIHERWSAGYRTPENEPFYEAAFDHVAGFVGDAGDAPLLDAGCGSGSHSIRLLRRGFRVVGVDVSTAALELARSRLAGEVASGQLVLTRASLTALPFADARFPFVLCWGVLMHVPEVPSAMAELARVMAPGAHLVLSEANSRSVQAIALRRLRRLFRRNAEPPSDRALGVEFWTATADGRLVTREAHIAALTELAGSSGLALVDRRAGQLTELYTRLPARWLRRVVHRVNDFWFRSVRRPGPAFGNILVFKKTPVEPAEARADAGGERTGTP